MLWIWILLKLGWTHIYVYEFFENWSLNISFWVDDSTCKTIIFNSICENGNSLSWNRSFLTPETKWHRQGGRWRAETHTKPYKGNEVAAFRFKALDPKSYIYVYICICIWCMYICLWCSICVTAHIISLW